MIFKPQFMLPVRMAKKFIILTDLERCAIMVAIHDRQPLKGVPPIEYSNLILARLSCFFKNAKYGFTKGYKVYGVGVRL